jgi:hypothetical protein
MFIIITNNLNQAVSSCRSGPVTNDQSLPQNRCMDPAAKAKYVCSRLRRTADTNCPVKVDFDGSAIGSKQNRKPL